MNTTKSGKLLFYLVIASCLLNQSCALLVKNQINKKYPPVSSIDKKIKSVCSSIKQIDTTTKYDASISLKNSLLDTVLSKTLKEETQQIAFNESRIDSLVLGNVNAKLGEQEIILSSNQKLYFNSLLSD